MNHQRRSSDARDFRSTLEKARAQLDVMGSTQGVQRVVGGSVQRPELPVLLS